MNSNFELVLVEHRGILLKVSRMYCRNEADREDLLQEMQIKLWQNISKYNPEFKASTFIYRICLNVAISFYRKQGGRSYCSMPDEVPDRQEEVDDKVALLEQFILELKELDRALLLLYMEGKSHAEIGDIMGISRSNVGTKVARIKDLVKQKFNQ